MKKIYIAGPDVFLPNAKEVGEEYKSICQKFGYEGLFPLDNEINGGSKEEIAKKIAFSNMELIKKCDIVVANLNPFRGKEPDSGTVWECGYGYALGKKVIYYLEDARAYKEKFLSSEMDSGKDKDGMEIEDFNLPLNLMIACSAELIKGGFEEAIKSLS